MERLFPTERVLLKYSVRKLRLLLHLREVPLDQRPSVIPEEAVSPHFWPSEHSALSESLTMHFICNFPQESKHGTDNRCSSDFATWDTHILY